MLKSSKVGKSYQLVSLCLPVPPHLCSSSCTCLLWEDGSGRADHLPAEPVLSYSYCRQSSRDETAYEIFIYSKCLPFYKHWIYMSLAFIFIVVHCESLRYSKGKAYTIYSSRTVLFNITATGHTWLLSNEN